MNRRSVSIVLAFIILGSALGLSGVAYFDLSERHRDLQSDYNFLVNGHNLLQIKFNELESDYHTLNDTYSILVNNYTQLNQTHQSLILEYNQLNESYQVLANNNTELIQSYTELSDNYETLEQDYREISDQYTGLFSEYSTLSEAFNDPLSYEEVPSIQQLEQWLSEDKTDEIEYDMPSFICGDFSVMLAQHAKLKNWDMGVVAVHGYKVSDGTFDHAFNAIVCDEGLVYVEPQTDEVWWHENYEEIPEGAELSFPGFGSIYVERYDIIVWYD